LTRAFLSFDRRRDVWPAVRRPFSLTVNLSTGGFPRCGDALPPLCETAAAPLRAAVFDRIG